MSETAAMKKKPWERPQLRSEQVQETLAQPACQYKPPSAGGGRTPPYPQNLAFS